MKKIKHEIKDGVSTLIYLNGSTPKGDPMFHRYVIPPEVDVDSLDLPDDEKDVIKKGRLHMGEKMVIYDNNVRLGDKKILNTVDIDSEEYTDKPTKEEKDTIKAARKLDKSLTIEV